MRARFVVALILSIMVFCARDTRADVAHGTPLVKLDGAAASPFTDMKFLCNGKLVVRAPTFVPTFQTPRMAPGHYSCLVELSSTLTPRETTNTVSFDIPVLPPTLDMQ